jgi:hypothetical protein
MRYELLDELAVLVAVAPAQSFPVTAEADD